ncbi:hypothetical protein HDF26_001985 [Pedobacter cryoconitis]|uniref:hypothetical protein n=1 Tax=Pedobacter cryoconitis TaxID=188932 RepID=UPI001804EC23|nr:hypothetical protein [Pedobacter cryoconitis]MBB6271558.1 hypothetical protein [Pedobacter cryoconitis]
MYMISKKNILISGLISGAYFIALFSGQLQKIASPLPGVFVELFTVPLIILQFLTLIYLVYLVIKKIKLPAEFYVSAVIAAAVIACVFNLD